MAAKNTASSAHTTMHTSGIYADMTLDGPEIGTLVVVLDRAKNLPNRRTMGKQNPYCAARLGKYAKKTATDMRGGQTPKWDQELRFTVHDSPDYNTLKLSVFNDDKKTDLIGETLTDLTDVIRPGGGQSDQWHGLNCKGRYAGEIRIELTYYDTRPRAQRHSARERKQSQSETLDHNPNFPLGGPRQPQMSIQRRPLPGEPAYPQHPVPEPVSTGSNLSQTSRNYYSRQRPNLDMDARHEDYENALEDGFRRNGSNMLDMTARSDLSQSDTFSAHHQYEPSQMQAFEYNGNALTNVDHFQPQDAVPQDSQAYDQANEIYIPVSDDPYALQAIEAYQNHREDHDNTVLPQQARHNRIQALSGSYSSRLSPSMPLSHTHSAPVYSIPDQKEIFQVTTPASGRNHIGFESSDFSDSGVTDFSIYHDQAMEYDNINSKNSNHNRTPNNWNGAIPPLPPTHRNSAPAVARMTVGRSPPTQHIDLATLSDKQAATSDPYFINNTYHESTEGYRNGQHTQLRPQLLNHTISAPATESGTSMRYDTRDDREKFSDNLQRQFNDVQTPSRASQRSFQTGKPTVRERTSMPAFNPGHRQGHQSQPENYRLPQAISGNAIQPEWARERQMHATPSHDSTMRHVPISLPLMQPRAISPVRPMGSSPVSHLQQSQYAPVAYTPSQSTSTSVPFSPESFAVFNPRHSNPPTPITVDIQSGSRQISPQHGSQTHAASPTQLPSSQTTENVDGPIIGSDGRIKDPSDHLPPSSYAPEPERKGGRQTTVVTVRNRFGPREAPSVPVAARQSHSAPVSPLVNKSVGQKAISQQPTQRTQAATGLPSNRSQQGVPTSQYSQPGGVPSARGYGYDRVEMFAPPIPDKIPLDTPKGGMNRDVTANGHDAASGTSKDQPSRVRRSRWGA